MDDTGFPTPSPELLVELTMLGITAQRIPASGGRAAQDTYRGLVNNSLQSPHLAIYLCIYAGGESWSIRQDGWTQVASPDEAARLAIESFHRNNP